MIERIYIYIHRVFKLSHDITNKSTCLVRFDCKIMSDTYQTILPRALSNKYNYILSWALPVRTMYLYMEEETVRKKLLIWRSIMETSHNIFVAIMLFWQKLYAFVEQCSGISFNNDVLSVMQRLHIIFPHSYSEACAAMSHFMTYSFWLALKF